MLGHFLCILLLIHGVAAAGGRHGAPPAVAQKWNTLSGDAPAVIARGGFSGLFPDSSLYAYQSVATSSVSDFVLYCDLQLTKDAVGICKSELRLENSTNIADVYPKRQSTYSVNGESMTGWFPLDFTAEELLKDVFLIQSIYSRSNAFDGQPISLFDDVTALEPPRFWLNVQHDTFYKQHKLDATEFISTISRDVPLEFISSPEVGFLKGLDGKFPESTAKLVFRFLAQDAVEPTTNSTYGSLLKDLNTVKSFASGILVPKDYIWPVDSKQYLEPATSLVADAHKLGLEVYASTFANDMPASYNYSYDPTAEYLQFVDNGDFSVDGVLTDFPPTASEAIACLAHNRNSTQPTEENPLIITSNGASGIFPGCSDLAYQKAVEDGADIIDCSVQMSKDGVPFCLDSPDLMSGTNAMVSFMPQASMVPEIQKSNGIFAFDLTWSDIQSVKPQLVSPFSKSGLERNPAAKNLGRLMSLPEFLDFAKNSTVKGILISVENAPYLASKKGLSVVDAVSSALANASFDEQTTQKVLIQSTDTSVLSAFKREPGYTRVLKIEETISAVPKDSIDEIKKFADAVAIQRNSILTTSAFFLKSMTGVVPMLQHANISVYVSVLRNEFVTQAFDLNSDPVLEVATYVNGVGVDGIVTEFPGTAKAYLRSPCSDTSAELPYTILPANPGDMMRSLVPDEARPPAEAPAPPLAADSVVDPPLPPVVVDVAADNETQAAPSSEPKPSSGPPSAAMNAAVCLFLLMLSFMCSSYHQLL